MRARRPRTATARRGVRGAGLVVSAIAILGAVSACDSGVTANSADETTVPSLQARAEQPSSGTHTRDVMPSPVPSATPTAPPPVAAPPDGAPGAAPPCPTDGLDITLGPVHGAAGSTVLTVVFTNSGDAPCTIDGYPGVSYVADDGVSQVGSPAVRDGDPAGPVTLDPGTAASDQIRAAQALNYSQDDCHPTAVSGLMVYPPNNTDSVVLPYETTGCAAQSPEVTQLSVRPVVPGVEG